MTTVSTNKVLMVTAGAMLALGSLAGCSGSGSGGNDGGTGGNNGSEVNGNQDVPSEGSLVVDSVDPAPVGGINGPARVDPDAVGVNDGESQD